MNKINNKDAAMVFRQGADEIEALRSRIDVLQAKADVIDIFAMALSGNRPQGIGAGECVAANGRLLSRSIDGQ